MTSGDRIAYDFAVLRAVPHVHLGAFEPFLDLESGLPKDLTHRQILGVRGGPESIEAVPDSQQGQPFEQQSTQAFPMKSIIHGHGDFRGVLVCRKV